MMHLWSKDYVAKMQLILMIMFKFVIVKLIARQAGVFLGSQL